ncbi:MAG: 4a-hydroxytetrahydrobiopterin dehydratase [Crocinitomicaceae bacterium]|jgi:4a-hydroxytetrahydrobiopterin dehydratase
MNWLVKEKEILGLIEFENQTQLAEFILELAKYSDRMNHHADLNIRHNMLSISITTHDSGGLTQKDYDLKDEIDCIKKDDY